MPSLPLLPAPQALEQTRLQQDAESQVRSILDSALDCIITIDQEGIVQEFNRAAELAFGYSREEALGRSLADLIVPPHLREAHRRGLARYLATGVPQVLGRRVELSAVRASGEEFPVELTVTALPGIGPPMFTGFLRDLTERRRAEARLSAQQAVSQLLSECCTLPEAAPGILKVVCESLEWEVGGLWILEPGGGVLQPRTFWHPPRQELAAFARTCRDRTFARGVGLPGRVWAVGAPAWIPDVAADENFPRSAAAARAGLHGAFGFPILLDGDVTGVLEFFSRSVRQPDDDLGRMMAAIGSQIGQFIARKRAEGSLRYVMSHARCLLWHGIAEAPEPPDYRYRWTFEHFDEEAAQRFLPLELLPGESYPVAFYRNVLQEDQKRIDCDAVLAFQAGAREYSHELRCRRADGEVRWLYEQARIEPLGPDRWRVVSVSTDVTERKRAEEALQYVANHAQCLLWYADVTEKKDQPGEFAWQIQVFDEEAAQRFVALDLQPEERYTDAWHRSKLLEDRPRLHAYAAAALREGAPRYSQEFRCLDGEGEIHWLHEEVHVHAAAPGRWRLAGVCTDITERKQAEETLRYVMAHARCVLWHGLVQEVLDDAGKWVFAWDIHVSDEEAAQRFLPLELAPGEPYCDGWYRSRLDEDRARTDRASSLALARRKTGYRQEFRCRQKDGEVRWLQEEVVIQPLSPGRWRLVGVCGDVTEAKRAEEALRHSEEHFRSLIESSTDIITILAPDGVIRYESPSLRRVLGYEPDELLGKHAFDYVHPEDLDLVRASLAGVVEGSDNGRLVEFRVRHADGSWRVLEASGKLLPDERAGGVALVNSRDITDRKNLEAQLRQSQKMEAIGQLAGGVAHDFNNMLAVINGYSELLLLTPELGAKVRDYLEEIRKAGERASGLTRQLLAFARRQVLQPQVLDLNQTVAGIERMLQRLIGEDIDLLTLLRPGLRLIRSDAGQIEQVILNLAVNARDAMPGGGKLTLETANVDFDEAYARLHPEVRPGSYVMLAATDTGCGMDAPTLTHIFEPFFTTKEQGKGTGLGLATIYGIVMANGGHISVESAPGEGATFRVYLPSADQTAGPAAETGSETPARGKETVLLTEDEPAVRALVRSILETAGYRVLEATDPGEAIRLAQEHPGPIHLLLTDVVMPGLSGRQLAEQLQPQRSEMKILYMTGYTDDAIVRHGVQEAGTALLQKPFTPAALTRIVRSLLDGGERRAESVGRRAGSG